MRILKSARFTLEPQCSSHAEEMFRVLSDPAIYEYENAPPQSADWLRGHFEKLEPRKSPDGTEQWLNWVVRLPTGELIGYVQATVKHNGSAYIAYEFASAFWGRGLASEAVNVMIAELELSHQVQICLASLKAKNLRSFRLLERLGFLPGSAKLCAEFEVLQSDEVAMQRRLTIG